MASLRRPTSFFPSHKHDTPRSKPKAGDASRRREPSKSKVEQKMKNRRMSRYAGPEQFNISSGGNADYLSSDPYQFTLEVAAPMLDDDEDSPAPLRPTVPIGGVFPGTSPNTRPRDLAIDEDDEDIAEEEDARDEQIRPRALEAEWDFSDLLKDNVDVASYIRKTLTGADDNEKKRFIAALHRQLDDNSKDLRRTVFKNYAEFVSMSKEISTLENDMIELKELLTEWKTVPQLMGMDDTLAPTLDKDGNVQRSRTRRHSPLDLQQMYRQQITALWSTVEGSQKYLPLAPGRHLVFETHAFIELNPATYKAKQSVSLFLLNDLLLVAGRRRLKTNTAPSDREGDRGRMVAERCWVLGDLVVVDLKDTGDLTNALKVKRGKEVCVYRASKADDKKQLLQAFRQVSNELAERRRKESEAEQERRRTLWQGDSANARMTRMSMFMQMDQQRPLSTIGTSLAETKDLLWIDEFGDDLTMAIAKQDWEKSVTLVERGQDLLRTVANNADATEFLQFRLDSLRPTVIQHIANELCSPDIRKKGAKDLIALLCRLDRAELARDQFLKARHDLTVRLVRTIKHEGDISLYINELAVVCFTIIRHTSDWYINAFELVWQPKEGSKGKDNHMASGFVIWAKEQIEYFADIFRRQVYAPTIDDKTVQECLQVTSTANRKLLRDVGLDFTFLLNSLVQRDPSDVPTATTNSPQVEGFNVEMPSPYVPSFSTMPKQNHPAPPDLSHGTTAPLSISRRARDTPPSSMRDRDISRTVSGASLLSNSSVNSGTASPVMRPPRSERRSRPPPAD